MWQPMILSRILKNLFSQNKAQPSLQMDSGGEPPFFRNEGIPSILVMTHSYQGNGAAVMLVFVLEWLVRVRGWQVQALSTELSDGDKKFLKRMGVGLVSAVNPEQYDFAICNTVVSGFAYVEQFGHHLPCLLWVHEGEIVLWNSRGALGDWKRIFSMSKHVVFQTRWQAERIFGSFTSGFMEDQYSVIPNCLPNIPKKSELEAIDGSEKKKIVFIGGVYDRKRPFDLMQAVLKIDRSDIECIFVGTTDLLSSEMQAVLSRDSRFRVTGEVNRQAATAILATADVLSLPSGDESQPIVLLEAAALNVPIVISDLSVHRGIWTHGENCLVHPVGDVDCLAMHLTTCLAGNAPRPVLPKNADFSQHTFFDRFEMLFDRFLPEKLKHYGEQN
jgi:glycosyltransferase involved in cell wall biosynthesis